MFQGLGSFLGSQADACRYGASAIKKTGGLLELIAADLEGAAEAVKTCAGDRRQVIAADLMAAAEAVRSCGTVNMELAGTLEESRASIHEVQKALDQANSGQA